MSRKPQPAKTGLKPPLLHHPKGHDRRVERQDSKIVMANETPGQDPLSVEWVSSLDAFTALEPEWTSAVSALPTAPLHLSFLWLSEWWRTFGADQQVHCLILRDRHGIAGLAPLMLELRRHGVMSVPVARLMGNDYSARSDLLILRREDEVLRAIIRHLDSFPWWYLNIGRTPSESKAVKGLTALSKTEFSHCAQARKFVLPVVAVDMDWEAYLQTKSRQFRRSARRSITKSGALKRRWFPHDFRDLEVLFRDIERISEKTWKHREGTSLASSAAAWTFYRRVMTAACRQGNLAVSLLYDGGTPVAFMFGVVFGGTLYGLKTGYDEGYASVGLGFRMLADLVRLGIADDRVQRLDLDCITSRSSWKQRWATEHQELVSLYFFRRSIMGSVLGQCYTAAKRWRGPANEYPDLAS